MNALLWGCGADRVDRPGWVCSDLVDYGQGHVGDVLDGLPWPDGRFGFVVAHHSLQALRPVDVERALVELARVTRPGGWLRGTVPDLLAGVAALSRGEAEWFPGEPAAGPGRAFHRWVTWFGDNRSVFTRRSLAAVLAHCGWAAVATGLGPDVTESGDDRICAADGPRSGRADESIWFEAQKPKEA